MKPTDEELAFAADVRRRDKALRRWIGKRNSYYRTEDVPARLQPLPTNEERSRAEVIEFRANPLPYGQSYGAYLMRNKEWEPHCGNVPRIGADKRPVTQFKITTWTGDTLADVGSHTARRVRGQTLTNERGSFWARGIDGRLYYGRHSGAGMYCRMRAAKHQGA